MHLDSESRNLLEQVIRARGDRHPNLWDAAHWQHLSDAEVDAICLMLSAGLVATGLGPDDEPTPRGLLLERLLDAVNRERLGTTRP